jgi:hypothetical protein
MSTWNISLWQSGSTYVSDGTIPRPNENLETTRLSTMQKVTLANGDNAFITPETKYIKQPFSMFFADTTSTFRTQIENYISNGDKVKITTHTGEIFTGKFLDMKRVWFVGVSPDEYDVNVTFEQVA